MKIYFPVILEVVQHDEEVSEATLYSALSHGELHFTSIFCVEKVGPHSFAVSTNMKKCVLCFHLVFISQTKMSALSVSGFSS